MRWWGRHVDGDPDASPAVWLVNRSDGQRIEATWPPNSFARFGDKLEIVLASGAVYYVEGDMVTGGCMDDDGWAIKDSRYGTPPLP